VADTIADILISNQNYVSINTLTSIAVGTEIILTNKSNSEVLLQVSSSQPSASSKDGIPLQIQPYSSATKTVTSGENEVWAKSTDFNDALVAVQEV